MRWLAPASFRSQIAIVGAASAAVVGLASLLIRDAVVRTEGRLVGEGLQQCRAVCQELAAQYRERNLYGGDSLDTLPAEALEVSLAALSATVLRAYDGIEAGFYDGRSRAVVGRRYPTRAAAPLRSLAPEELELVRAAASEAAGAATATRVLESGRDAAVVAVMANGGSLAVWALKRLPAVGRLLAFGRPDSLDRRIQDLVPLVRRALDVARAQAGAHPVELVFATPVGRDLSAEVDGLQIEQVLINLLLNAVEALPARIEIGAARVDGRVEITVRDDGSGIPAEAQPQVFDAYFTTKPSGTGLGLAVSRVIVRSHGGELTFASGASGRTFRLALPCRSRDGA